jgi:cell division control protein 24
MASTTAGRKTISVYNPRGDNPPIANNTLLNKAASQSTSLYQQCSSLRARLMRIQGFAPFFALSSADSRSSTDPVTHLWDLFSLGVPLCYIFNLLPPPITPVNIDTFPDFDVNDDRLKKRAIALFAMGVKQVPQTEAFTVRDLWDRESTDGLVKVRTSAWSLSGLELISWVVEQVINTVTTIVDMVPQDLFELPPPSPSFISQESVDPLNPGVTPIAANSQESARMNIIRELVETERKYVQDLEIMQVRCSPLL